ncbi:hypothetical protein SAMN06265338_106208 [Rhodoblastus acidophilus]|uniref:Glycosyltransferase family 1 protein n=1 Tax=Rhodoblastus acidophilus TaxID=1074 RepID=A0A212RRS9_RHOAC|nr:hypothetical protein [Rhodoblastus acidophilus]MCW2316272.1 hypothetical protein [Rhodoblastus acidophilus]PPQ38609.1 hypothetical protein CKO16_10000 [Rhodoblastus acidophilus]RAI19762.1 hypothetical protein CH337_11065 [Rhodoblastus acidophilus]SNB75278.1 hypothetical protein SAMN06265338_106208 [Rhodoblastus acidophilus]
MKSIYPDLTRHPYYIVTPNYTSQSGGVKALHLLCHWLNRTGERAYILAYGGSDMVVNPDFLTPLLRPEIVDAHGADGLTPIVVYPEVVVGNPLQAQCVARYVLNYPGLLGGDKVYAPEELAFGFTKKLAEACGPDAPVLHMPLVDRSIFNPGRPRLRKGAAFYAYKYRDLHGQQVFGLPDGAIEITKCRPDSQTPAVIADILRSVEVFYSFEDTQLNIEALLCGCPVVLMRNSYLKTSLGEHEYGLDGIALGDSPQELERARDTVVAAQFNYQNLLDNFEIQLAELVKLTQAKAAQTPAARVNASIIAA